MWEGWSAHACFPTHPFGLLLAMCAHLWHCLGSLECDPHYHQNSLPLAGWQACEPATDTFTLHAAAAGTPGSRLSQADPPQASSLPTYPAHKQAAHQPVCLQPR